MSGAEQNETPPRVLRIVLRLLWVGAVVTFAVALVLGIVGAAITAEGLAVLPSLLPAILAIGLGMAIPPWLVGLLAFAIVSRPPRALRRELNAVAIGGAVGALVSPVVFYQSFPQLGLVVAVVLVAVLVPAYALSVRAEWRRARPASASR